MFSPIFHGPAQNAYDHRITDDWTPIKMQVMTRTQLEEQFANPRVRVCGVESLARPEGITTVVFYQEHRLPNDNHIDDEHIEP